MAKKNDKSSKTAHVLNLITSPAEKAAAQKAAAELEAAAPELVANEGFGSEAAEAAAVNQQAAQVHQPLIPPILQVAHRHDESLAEQIRGALEDELAPELTAEPAAPAVSQRPKPLATLEPQPAPVPQPEPEPVPTPQAAPQPAPTPQAAPQPAPTPQAAPQPALAPEQSAPQPQFKLPASAIVSSFTIPEPPPLPPLDEELNFVNVMQMLVESMAPRYVEKFGLCGCPRCLEDVKALALTNLGPKYTVFRASERVPMLTVYEKRYASQVAAELTKACDVVKANPRHR